MFANRFGLYSFILGGVLASSLQIPFASSQAIPQKLLGISNVSQAANQDLSSLTPTERKLRVLRRAKPLSLEQPTRSTKPARSTKKPKVVPGQPGRGEATATQGPTAVPIIVPNNFGAGSLSTINHYSDRLVPLAIASQYPYSTTGIFAYTDYSGGSFYCSAALISKSILLTAGHCVHKGGGGGAYWLRGGTFYPAISNGTKPYGLATASGAYTTSGWYNTGSLDEGYDVAVVVLNKRFGTANEIGAYTGWLGLCYENCLQPYWSNTQIGYPSNYYSGDFLTEGTRLEYSDGRDYRAGSGMEGGSSGGPHVANIGDISDTSSNLGQYAPRNIAFAVTSWGFTDQTLKIQGFSTTTGPANSNNFKSIYNTACNHSRALHGAASCNLLP